MNENFGAAPAAGRRQGGRALRRQRIFARLREGWAYPEIARAEKVSVERIRKIVAETLARRVIDDGSEHARVQLARLDSALQSAGEAVAAGDIKAIGPYLRVLDRVDHYRGAAAAALYQGGYHRQKLLDKLNRMAEALKEEKEEKVEKEEKEEAARLAAPGADGPAGEDERASAEEAERASDVAKFFPPNFGRKH